MTEHIDKDSAVMPLALKPAQAARALGISERLLWTKTNQGQIPHLKLGKRTIYPVGELEKWLGAEAWKAVRGEI